MFHLVLGQHTGESPSRYEMNGQADWRESTEVASPDGEGVDEEDEDGYVDMDVEGEPEGGEDDGDGDEPRGGRR